MKRQTILKAWAIFGVYAFLILSVLTWAYSGLPVIIMTAFIPYIGGLISIVSIASLVYEKIRPAKTVPAEQKPEEAKPMQ